MSLFKLYLFFVVLPNLNILGGMLFGISLAVGIGGILGGVLVRGGIWESDPEDEKEKKIAFSNKLFGYLKLAIPMAIIGTIISMTAPTEKQLYLLTGSYAATIVKSWPSCRITS